MARIRLKDLPLHVQKKYKVVGRSSKIKQYKGWVEVGEGVFSFDFCPTKSIIFHLDPHPAPRISHRGRLSPRAKSYYNWRNELNRLADSVDFLLPDTYKVIFCVAFPKSRWGKSRLITIGGGNPIYTSKELRSRLVNKPHKVKPDSDNLEKALRDALRHPELHPNHGKDDSTIWNTQSVKVWTAYGAGRIIIYY